MRDAKGVRGAAAAAVTVSVGCGDFPQRMRANAGIGVGIAHCRGVALGHCLLQPRVGDNSLLWLADALHPLMRSLIKIAFRDRRWTDLCWVVGGTPERG